MTVFAITSCKTNFKVQVYRFEPSIDYDVYDENQIRKKIAESDVKSITLRNDSVLEYKKRYGGLYSSTSINYKIDNNELIIDSLNHAGYDVSDVTSVHFLYSQDSLINKKTNEKYYNQKYLDKKKN
jgi:hypothetical protein